MYKALGIRLGKLNMPMTCIMVPSEFNVLLSSTGIELDPKGGQYGRREDNSAPRPDFSLLLHTFSFQAH